MKFWCDFFVRDCENPYWPRTKFCQVLVKNLNQPYDFISHLKFLHHIAAPRTSMPRAIKDTYLPISQNVLNT